MPKAAYIVDLEDVALKIQQVKENDPKMVSLSLKRVQFGKNLELLAQLADAVSINTCLTELDISNNLIRDKGAKFLFQIITNSKSLIKLDISFNFLSPCIVTKTTNFVKKNFSLRYIHIEEIALFGAIALLKPLSCPHVALARKGVEEIIAQNNALSSVGEEKSLGLSLPKRLIKIIPQQVLRSTHLKTLNLSNNKIEVIPDEFGALVNLKKLNLSNNNIKQITPLIGNIEGLTNLNMENNLLTTIPFTLGSLTQLHSLNLSENLLLSNYSYPKFLLEKNEVSTNTQQKRWQISEPGSFSRLFFIGDRNSRIYKVLDYLKVEYFCSFFKLSSEQLAVLREEEVMAKKSKVHCADWFVQGKMEEELSSTSSSSSSTSISRSRPRMNSFRMLKESARLAQVQSWLFDPIFTSIARILTLGKNNQIPIVLSFRFCENMPEMTSNLFKLLHQYHKKDSTIILIGTYRDKMQKKKKTKKTLTQLINTTFPSLPFEFILFDLSTGKQSKSINKAILSKAMEAKPFASLPDASAEAWFNANTQKIETFIEHLLLTKEQLETKEKEAPDFFQTWEMFLSNAALFDFEDHECDDLANMLRHRGIIHHFRDVSLPHEKIEKIEKEKTSHFLSGIFLKPEMFLDCYTALLSVYTKDAVQLFSFSNLNVIPSAALSQAWEKMVPTAEFNILLAMLEECHAIYSFDFSSFLLCLSMLPEGPKALELDYVPTWSNGESQYIIRCYVLEKMTDLQFLAILIGIHKHLASYHTNNDDGKTALPFAEVFQNYIDISLHDDKQQSVGFCRIGFDYSQSQLILYVNENNQSKKFFCAMAHFLSDFLSTSPLFPSPSPTTDIDIGCICTCSSCYQFPRISRQRFIPLHCVEKVADTGKQFLYCGQHAIRMDFVAPDLTFQNLLEMNVPYTSIDVIKKVGDGGFASVHYGMKENQELAVKVLDKMAEMDECFPEFRKEVLLMAGLQHPNTVGLLGLCTDPFCILTEFCAYGDLWSYISSRRERNIPLPFEYIFEVLTDIARGMMFLHTATPPILHRDLKTPNILLCRVAKDEAGLEGGVRKPSFLLSNSTDSLETAKVADFGLSLKTTGPITERVVDNPIWLAPELLSKKPYSYASDVYAFAIIMNELFSLEMPFSNCNYQFMFQLEDLIIDGARPSISDGVCPDIKDLIERCWHQEPEKRPCFQDIFDTLTALQTAFLLQDAAAEVVQDQEEGVEQEGEQEQEKEQEKELSDSLTDDNLEGPSPPEPSHSSKWTRGNY